MNNTEILALTYKLKEEIKNSDIYLNLKENERKMLESEDCSRLLYLYQIAQNEYNEAKRFEKYGSNVEDAQKKLYEAKLKVDTNELVKKYNESYKLMKKELKKLEKIIFKDIRENKQDIE